MTDALKKILSILSPQERRQAMWLIGAILLISIIDVTGIASTLPFMATLANTRERDHHEAMADIFNSFDRGTEQRFMGMLVTKSFSGSPSTGTK